ncbi:MAG: SRPBCC family protein [Chitinophagales bacterium]
MLNKILKSVIGLVSISFAIFLIIGIPKTKHEISSTFSVERPINEVYDYILNVNNAENWLEGFISAKKVKGNIGEAGCVYEVSLMEFGKISERTQTIIDLKRPTNIDYEWDKEDAFGTFSIELEENGKTTVVKEMHTFQGKGFVSRFIIKAFKKFIVKSQKVSQENLKRALEEELSDSDTQLIDNANE